MADRSPYLRGANLGMLVALATAVVLGGFLTLGPGHGLLAERRAALRDVRERVDAWSREIAAFRPPAQTEQNAWLERWQVLLTRVPVATNGSQVTARVAGAFDAPSVRKLVVERADAVPEAETEATALASPDGGVSIDVREMPLRVRFVASFPDTLAILAALEAGVLPVRLEALDMRREFPDVAVRLEFTYFARTGETS